MSSVSAVSSSTPIIPVFKPTKVEKLDQIGGLFQTSLPDSTDDNSVAFVYSKTTVAKDAALPKAAIFLKNADGSYFSVDLHRDADTKVTDKVSMVATSSTIDLYIYNPDATGSAEKYSFDATGKMTGDGPATLGAMEVSSAEISTKRDLDGNGGIGANLDKTANGPGMLDATGGMYQVNVLGQNVLVVGNALEKAKSIDVSANALRNVDGSAWAPETEFASYRAVSTVAADKSVSWTVYGTTAVDESGAGGDVHKFTFKAADDKKGFVLDGEEVTLSASQLATAEKTSKRDLNADGTFGVKVQTDAVDAKGGLYSGSILGQDFYLIGTGLKTAAKADAAQDLSGSLLNGEGEAWVKPEGYTISALVKNKADADHPYSMYAYKSASGSDPEAADYVAADKNDVLRFDFDVTAGGNYKVTDATADGVAMTASDLAKAEKTTTRDLNQDAVFGVTIQPGAVDATGGLYQATALGNSFLVVGKSLVSSAAKPMDLSSALLTTDGEAWKPDDVANISNQLKIVTEVGQDKAVTGYSVYVKEDAGSFAKYSFGADFKQTGERTELTQEDLATAEKTNNRDLSGDNKFGVILTGSPDAKGGLYQGHFESQDNVFIRSDAKLALGGLVASKAVDMSNALKTEEGYWDVESGYNITAAYTEGTGEAQTYNVIAANAQDVSDVRKYTFNAATNMLDTEHSGDMSLIDLAAAEKAQKRDLNGDSVVAVKVSATLDKVGGLFQVQSATKNYLAISSTAVKDLSTAILDSDGKAWAVPGNNASVVLSKQGDSYKIYTKSTDATPTYNEYAVSADFKYVEDSAKTLSLTDLADAEKTSGRDINGDRAIGATVSKVIDKTGLYEATIDNQKMVLFSSTNPGKSTALSDKVLLSSDETSPWAAGSDYSLRSVVKNEDDTIQVYATKVQDGKDVTSRFTFTADRVLSEQEDLTADQLATAEKTLGRDLNADKAVGLAVTGVEDKVGGLYKASVMGQDFYVLGAKGLKTGTSTASAIDLSKALLDTEGNAWKLDDGFKVGGVITTKNADGDITSYDLYTYKKTGSDVTDVKKTSWDGNMNYMDSVAADPVALVDVEAKNARDLSGDGTVGFRKVGTDDAQYLGVTSARVVGNDLKFWLAGSDLKPGSPSKPLTIKDALLSDDGTAPWQIDEGYKIKAVLDGTGVNTDKRYVYATNTENNSVLRYSFSKVDGKSAGAGESVNSIDLAKLETDLKKDLNGDTKVGVLSVTDVKDDTRSTGLVKASLLGQDFFVVNKVPTGTKNINLTSALLNADGSAWTKPSDFAIKGVYQPDANTTEVYGTGANDQLQRYKFTPTMANDVATGSWTVSEPTDADPLAITGTTLAKDEASAKKDLNGDGAIGFKVGAGIASQSNGWSVGKAGVGTPPSDAPDTDQVYIVGKNLAKMGTVATNLANSAALQYTGEDGNLAYWKPDAGFVVNSIQQPVETPGTVNLFASKVDADSGNTTYMKYVFKQGQDADKTWTLDSASSSATPLTSKDFVQTEIDAKRDLNGDGAVGLKAGDIVVSGLIKASIDNQEFLMVAKSLTSGTSSKPLGFNALLQKSDGTAWTPDEGVTATSWTALVAPLAEGVPADSKFALVKSDSSTSYFGADYKELTA